MSIEQYLSRYAEAEAALIPKTIAHSFNKLIVIPAKDEPIRFFERLKQLLLNNSGSLAIVVINQSNTKASAENIALYDTIKTEATAIELGFYVDLGESGCIVVDRFTTPLPEKQGVGLARKIGCDIALALIAAKAISTGWIACSDADVHWPKDYFSLPLRDNKTAALIYPFKHQLLENAAAIRLYELRQYYYVQGLAWAGSPYAYTTVGSTLVINAEHYAKVRGFPKLAAGEDFHILNKLAKTGEIYSLSTPTLEIEDRISLRVPFGTGPMLQYLSDEASLQYADIFEAEHSFFKLKALLELLPSVWACNNAADGFLRIISQLNLSAKDDYTSIQKTLNHAFKQSKNYEQFKRNWHNSFDALATLKFIHTVSEHLKQNANDITKTKPPWLSKDQIDELQSF